MNIGQVARKLVQADREVAEARNNVDKTIQGERACTTEEARHEGDILRRVLGLSNPADS